MKRPVCCPCVLLFIFISFGSLFWLLAINAISSNQTTIWIQPEQTLLLNYAESWWYNKGLQINNVKCHFPNSTVIDCPNSLQVAQFDDLPSTYTTEYNYSYSLAFNTNQRFDEVFHLLSGSTVSILWDFDDTLDITVLEGTIQDSQNQSLYILIPAYSSTLFTDADDNESNYTLVVTTDNTYDFIFKYDDGNYPQSNGSIEFQVSSVVYNLSSPNTLSSTPFTIDDKHLGTSNLIVFSPIEDYYVRYEATFTQPANSTRVLFGWILPPIFGVFMFIPGLAGIWAYNKYKKRQARHAYLSIQ